MDGRRSLSWRPPQPARQTPSSPGQTGPGKCSNTSLCPANRVSTPPDTGPESHDLSLRNRCICKVRGAANGSSFPYNGRCSMEFVDRLLTCADCGGEFIFTAGEQLFFLDKQFKNDPKRCKPCKSRRSAQSASATTGGPAAAGISRTETRTECSECGITTTVPFKPTQGRPVLCRQCFKNKRTPVAATENTAAVPAELVAAVSTAPAAELGQGSTELASVAQPAQA